MERIIVNWPNGCNFIQTGNYLGITTDCALLAAFPGSGRCENAVDLGCGTGAAGILLAHRNEKLKVTLLDIQRGAVDIARENVFLNGLGSRISTLCADMRFSFLPSDSYDLIICNPPYFVTGSGKRAKLDTVETARGDGNCTIEEVCSSASRLLKTGGRFACVFRPERTVDLFCAMRKSGIEPKRIQRVLDRAGCKPSLILVEGRKGGGVSLVFEDDLIMRDENGDYTAELLKMYNL